jgi:hypothetical protein
MIMAKAKKAPTPPKAPSPYELVGLRVLKIINSPSAQKAKSAILTRLPEEAPEYWEGVLEEFGEADNVTLNFLDDGSVEISWVRPEED